MFEYTDEYESKYNDRYFGKRRAIVKENQDPKKLGRIKVANLELFGNSISAWATPCLPIYGGRDSGFFCVPPIGSCVWIEFEEGLIDYPIYTGGYYPEIEDGHSSDSSPIEESEEFQSKSSSVPAHGRGEYDGSDFGGIKGNFGLPPSEFEGEYGQLTILQTPGGHMLEFDDTKGGERIQIHHSKGSNIEILQDGSINILSEGNILMYGDKISDTSQGDRVSSVSGNRLNNIDGDFSTTIEGNKSEVLVGDSNIEVGSLTFKSKSNSSYETDGILGISAANLMNLSSGGDLNMTSFGNVSLTSVNEFRVISLNSSEVNVGTPFSSPSLNMIGQNGMTRVASEDKTGLSVYGIEARGGTGGQVFIGDLSEEFAIPSLSIGPIPLIKEPLVMGIQLASYLTQLNTILSTVGSNLVATPFASVSGAGASLLTGVSILTPQLSTLNTTSAYVSP